MKKPRQKRDPIERFNEKWTEEHRGYLVDGAPSACHVWQAALTGKGYGTFYNGQKDEAAYRFSYRTFVGEIPPELELDHLCDQRDCVNPAHLEPKTHQQNAERAANHLRGRTHCPLGHPLEGQNLQVKMMRGKQVRKCKACLNIDAEIRRNERRDANVD